MKTLGKVIVCGLMFTSGTLLGSVATVALEVMSEARCPGEMSETIAKAGKRIRDKN